MYHLLRTYHVYVEVKIKYLSQSAFVTFFKIHFIKLFKKCTQNFFFESHRLENLKLDTHNNNNNNNNNNKIDFTKRFVQNAN